MIEVVMPQLGLTMEKGTIVRWLKQEGQEVRRGEPLFQVESDKAVLEVESPGTGFLRKVLVPQGGTVPVLAVVAHIAETEEELHLPHRVAPEAAAVSPPAKPEPTVSGPAAFRAPAEGPPGRKVASPRARRLAREEGVDLAQVRGSGPGGRVVEEDVLAYLKSRPKATPVARKVAAEAGLALEEVQGTGPGGRVVREDVERALAAQAAAAPPAVSKRVPVAGLRKIIAERMAASHQTTARVTLMMEADASAFVRLRNQLNGYLAESPGLRLGYNDLLVKIAAQALEDFPAMNAQWAGEEIRLLRDVHVGLAVDTDRGLVVVVVRNANQKGLSAIATELRTLVERARVGGSPPDDLSGGTFTVTNLGMYEVDAFTPIINLPESAILGVGRIKERPAAVDGEVGVRQMVWLSLTFDHRVVDGAHAARFLQRIKKLIEQPYLLLT
ncbi:MAG: dihydrolipoamide acetyltransferase family protein [Anaerolineae bacterium]